MRRLANNQSVLLATYRDTIHALDEGAAITPAAEWLIDNFHLIEKQVREIRLDLPGGYYRELPKIASGHLSGYPRVFGIAWAFVAHTDSRVDTDLLCRFLNAYQEVEPLTIGELWAVAITLRLTLLENLRRIAERITASREARAAADECCDRILATGGRAAEPLADVLRPYRRGRLPDAFAVQVCHRLRDSDGAAGSALTWLDERLARQGATTDQMIREEQQRQVAASGTVRNIVTSMRLVSDVDWAELVERVSQVDAILRAGSGFADMDFETRNLYRDAIEELARGSGRSEQSVARQVVEVVGRVDDPSGAARRCEPGFHLVGPGRAQLEAMLGFRPRVRTWPARATRRLGLGAYLGAIVASTIVLLLAPLWALAALGAGAATLAGLAALGAFPALDAAVAIVNRGLTQGLRARALPALELKGGVPQRLRTLVAVPVLLSELTDVDEQIDRLEIHYLSSPEGHLHFALLSDWPDAPVESVAADEALLRAAEAGVARLNRKYGPAPGGDRFLLFHRRRVWSESEGRWMGWERKRGKLHELNRALRGAVDTTFIPVAGQGVPRGVRYVITLDADTRLPRDSARRLIGKMAHPLNRPQFDAQQGRVIEGHAVLQPRVTPALPHGQDASLFRRVFSNAGGIDPYAAAVSDVYQDLFGEGSFTGKGIYDIDAFEAAMDGRVPDGTLLSHDLFEGVFARAGLASDVEVIEDFPDRYDVAAARQHRWARGDWQLLPWILGLRPGPGAPSSASGLPAVGRWKMLDNLRRSLSPGATLASLWLAWLLPAAPAATWTTFVLLTFAVGPLGPVLSSLGRRRPGVPLRARLHNLGDDLGVALLQVVLTSTFLAHQAWLMGDAIVRTMWRVFVSRRRLLEWTPAAQAAGGLRFDLAGFFRRMAPAAAVGAVGLALAVLSGSGSAWLAAGFALLWTVSPAIAFRVSQRPPAPNGPNASAAEATKLRLIARRTWRFFETFVTPADNMLPPDNFQEDPEAIAHRTSPTNIGLYLLSVAAARDFGWLGTPAALDRLESAFDALARMERFRGHLYNWYDTQDLRPLAPRYVSSVDSGNLAGHLLTLANALEAWAAEPPTPNARLQGVADALLIALETSKELRGVAPQPAHAALDASLQSLSLAIAQALASEAPLGERLAGLGPPAEAAVRAAEALPVDGDETSEDLRHWVRAIRSATDDHAECAGSAPDARIHTLAADARRLAEGMEFGFLLDRERMLLSIGYRAEEGELDPSCYDLLGSEARLASFLAIAKGDVPPRHWFRLSHAVTPVGRGAALISWSGSMFEYLMPALVMREPPGSVLEATGRLVVRRQVDHAQDLGVPWGMSESAYSARDLHLTYQYQSFGVPSLGLKRGLDDHVVVAPYATALAAMVDAGAAARNFDRLQGLGARGRHGFYEALDFTPTRAPQGRGHALVRAYMAHHQGMSIVAIANALQGGRMQAHFHAEPMVRATELLLEERMPREVVVSQPLVARRRPLAHAPESGAPGARRIEGPNTPNPSVHLLSNGSYTVMLTAAGSGYSRWRDIAVTRWREDSTCDDHGAYVFLRDAHSGDVWSAGHQPTGVAADAYHALFSEEHAEIGRRDGALTTKLEVFVSAEDDGEVRRVSITNGGLTMREIEVTSYAELALAPQAADVAHPAFSKLFVETEHLPAAGVLLATRRRRSRDEPEVWAAHLAVVEGELAAPPEFETDRAQVVERGRDRHAPARIFEGRALNGAAGAVLDPVFVLRRRVRVPPGATARISFWTLIATSRTAILDLVDKHHDPAAFERAANLAWTRALVQLHHLGLDRADAAQFQRLAGHLVYANSALRPPSAVLRQGLGGQPDLWRVGISGDLPIVLMRIAEPHDLPFVRQLIKAGEYWRAKQLAFDLVLLNERGASYVQDLQTDLEGLVRAAQSRSPMGGAAPAGRTYVLRADLTPPETRDLLASVARVVLSARSGTLAEQLDRLAEGQEPARRDRQTRPSDERFPVPPPPVLEFFNGHGGFDRDGREYVIVLEPGQTTPAPWINVVANPDFGFQVSADGAGYTWRRNSREHQLTPWSNDPVSDATGEAVFLRDQETGEVWTPTASPIRLARASYRARHGRGYSRFEHVSHGIEADLLQFAPLADPVKISRLRLHNLTARPRRISITAYVEWVLGPSRAAAAPFTVTDIDAPTGALLARNAWSPAFGPSVAFLDLGGLQASWTGDRRAFIGRNRTLAWPAAVVGGEPLSGVIGAGLDPCGALQGVVELPPFGAGEVTILLGEADEVEAVRALVDRYRATDLDSELAAVEAHWADVVGQIQVETPDRAMNIMLNGWLPYQTLASRVWARAGFYQQSGAYGFRDQLQDGMALAGLRPELTREHLLRAAARQFLEGDVQHWWLPHSGEGVRTRISDDRVWLAYAAEHYVRTTGDAAVLEVEVPFLEGAALQPDETERFFAPSQSTESASLYEHCARALDDSLDFGGHGLPLIGGGDWNDGMNRVGERGLGESVWLGWMLYATLSAFTPLAEARGDAARSRSWRAQSAALRVSLERNAWDGQWYRRGWFDDGSPLGSAASEECRIDAIAQSWAVLSGVASPKRARQAMASVRQHLILPDERLALLFTPPFDRSSLDPGYIKAYPPGVRENGGQYTHAAAWSVMALAALGDGAGAGELFAMLNPINHALTRTEAERYRVEPYVVAADIYSAPGHVGRGGWTWYTGSAAWLYRAGVESILGIRREATQLMVDPCIPPAWPGFAATVRAGSSRYALMVENPEGVACGVTSAELDGVPLTDTGGGVELADDGRDHLIRIRLGRAARRTGEVHET